MAEMPDLIAYQEKQQRQTAAKKPDLMAYQERQEAKKPPLPPITIFSYRRRESTARAVREASAAATGPQTTRTQSAERRRRW